MTARSTTHRHLAAPARDDMDDQFRALGQVLVMAWAAHDAAGGSALRSQLLDVLVEEGHPCYDDPLLRLLAVTAYILGGAWRRRSDGSQLVPPILRATPAAEPGEWDAVKAGRRELADHLFESYAGLAVWIADVRFGMTDALGELLVEFILPRTCLAVDQLDCAAAALASLAEVCFALGSAQESRDHQAAPHLDVLHGGAIGRERS